MIYYTNFHKAKVFDDMRLNVWCNQLYTILSNTFYPEIVDDIWMDGMVALTLQDEQDRVRDTRILFKTGNIDLFRFLISNTACLDISRVLIQEETIVFFLKIDHRIFLNYSKEIFSLIDFKGIKIRDKSEIK